jgi:hypothetical protein
MVMLMKEIHKNYDAVFKEAMVLFKDKTLDFLGLHGLPPITDPLSTEFAQIEVDTDILDLTFGLRDNRGLHLEEEVDLSYDDMLRSGVYHLDLSRVYKREFITVIFVKNPVKITEIRTEQFVFKPIIVQCSEIDADAILTKLKAAILNGESINELEIIYLPLFKSIRYNPTELFNESSKLISEMKADDKFKQKIAALLIALAGKVVDKTMLDKYAEEVKHMGNAVLEYFEEIGEVRGKKLGVELGEERGKKIKEAETAAKMLSKGYSSEDILDLTGITKDRLNEIAGYIVA